jgi:hypothetical protein
MSTRTRIHPRPMPQRSCAATRNGTLGRSLLSGPRCMLVAYDSGPTAPSRRAPASFDPMSCSLEPSSQSSSMDAFGIGASSMERRLVRTPGTGGRSWRAMCAAIAEWTERSGQMAGSSSASGSTRRHRPRSRRWLMPWAVSVRGLGSDGDVISQGINSARTFGQALVVEGGSGASSNGRRRSVKSLTFIDLFAGLGGFRLALSRFGFEGDDCSIRLHGERGRYPEQRLDLACASPPCRLRLLPEGLWRHCRRAR